MDTIVDSYRGRFRRIKILIICIITSPPFWGIEMNSSGVSIPVIGSDDTFVFVKITDRWIIEF